MIPDQIQFPELTKVILRQARTQPVAEVSLKVKSIDFSKNTWEDNGKTVFSNMQGWRRISVLGTGSPNPYDNAWTEDGARAALLAIVGITLPSPAPGNAKA